MQFARDVIDELIDLFPFRYIHLGGDECPTNKWQKNEECQSLLKEMGSTNFRDLQIYFYKQLKRLYGHETCQPTTTTGVLE